MQEIRQIAAAIDERMHQLGVQGVKGPAIADHMIGYMAGLQRIYDTASDHELANLCDRYPGFYRYASMMESVSEQNQAMMDMGSHPYGDLPVLPEEIKTSLENLMTSAAELERGYQSAVDSGRFSDHAEELMTLKRLWADDLQNVVRIFRSSDLPLRTQAVVQQVLKAMAVRIVRLDS